ncbi:MAG TPA: hypothetical protein VJH94_03610 [Candidatus Paceibacterota bacterium]
MNTLFFGIKSALGDAKKHVGDKLTPTERAHTAAIMGIYKTLNHIIFGEPYLFPL